MSDEDRAPASLRRAAEINHRDAGLDAVRSVAIWLVMINHAIVNLAIPDRTGYEAVIWGTGSVGVEIFFCLSGFLIGRILFDIESVGLSPALVGRFLARRWLRTLPLYYCFLGIMICLWPVAAATLPRFLLLTQNLTAPIAQPSYFPQSWSLTVEEISYVALPLLALGLKRTRAPVIAAVSVLILASLGYRLTFGAAMPFSDLRTVDLARLDAIAYGLLAAGLERHARGFGRRHWLLIAAAALPVMLWLTARLSDPGRLDHLYDRAFALPAFDLAFSAALPALCCTSLGLPILDRIVRFTSDRAYGLYIVHMLAAASTNVLLGRTPLVIQSLVYVGLSYAAATLLAVTIERPFMRLRPSQLPKGLTPG